MPEGTRSPQGRLLLCNIGRIGDTILRNSIISVAAKKYGRIDYICGRGNHEIVKADPRLNRVQIYRNSVACLFGTIRTAVLNHHDCYIDLKDHDSSISLLLAKISRAKLKVGFNRRKFSPFHRDTSAAYGVRRRKLDVMRSIADIAELDGGELTLNVPCTKNSETWFANQHPFDQPFYFANISATDPTRMWSTDNWVRTLNECGLNDWPVLISGVPEHAERVKELAGRIVRGLAFKPRGLMDVVAAIKQANVVFSVDTGLIQVAAAFEKPLVALFSSTNIASEFAPIGENYVILIAEDDRSLVSLDPQTVVQTVKASNLLCRAGGAPTK